MNIKNLVRVSVFTVLIIAGTFIKIPLPVCPITLQTLFAALAGVILGKKYGTLSVVCYVLLGLFGLPVFSAGGGIGYIFNPTFGYLLGFCGGTYLTGLLVSRAPHPTFCRLLTASLAGLAVVYACGIAYYWMIMTFYIGTGIALKTLFLYCFLLVIPGDLLSCVAVALLGKRLSAVVR